MIHAAVALVLQAIIGLTTGDWLVGAALGVGIFIGREHAQAEYRWIETYGYRRRSNMPWTGGFQFRVWNVKSILDFALPIVAVAAVIVLV